ncbi:MAG: hypothetical protein OMM_11405, partial [Candidatus Magnetoglobus multicellularis str. Araruama]
RSKHITACDFDPKAIETARLKNSAQNISFVLADIRDNMPAGQFENIIWDGAIEHFTLAEIENILENIKKSADTKWYFKCLYNCRKIRRKIIISS